MTEIPPDAFPNLRHLRLFTAVCDMGGINLAANALNISQPAITLAIARLEKCFGAVLLERQVTGSRPTAAGRILHARITRMDRQLGEAISGLLRAVQKDAMPVPHILARLTYRQLRAVILMSDGASISGAAEQEGVSASAITRVTRELQANLGRTIFVRGQNGVVLSRNGQNFALRCRVALREIDQAFDEMRELEGRMEGRVVVASLPLARTLLLGRTLNRLLSRYPKARIEVYDGSFETLSAQLRSGRCDILIGALRYGEDVQGLRTHPLFDDPYAIVGRKGHPLAQCPGGATLGDLAAAHWVVQRQHTPIRSAFDALFVGAPHAPDTCVETSSLVLTRSIIMESDKLAILSRRQIAVEEHMNLLTCIPLAADVAEKMRSRTIGVTTRENWVPGRLQQEFLDLLADTARTLDADLHLPDHSGRAWRDLPPAPNIRASHAVASGVPEPKTPFGD